ncbi:hypothetical protein MHLP_03350 [Candidatus Mycoplasma haematolamae str. Purdue]|uniref:Lipoprotein n=1 Tax=Mycoplasma haematolamae (strain Purdue) TaxID=1212765 RepID=I7BAC8_MYCHA|nr:hypothetical protein [Candidatus Mycoplasma haematolamae]AFO52250.1 hypothetical protein MHLP_03350 [Candidatus Mycoplasma haematolamae str. Purdue]
MPGILKIACPCITMVAGGSACAAIPATLSSRGEVPVVQVARPANQVTLNPNFSPLPKPQPDAPWLNWTPPRYPKVSIECEFWKGSVGGNYELCLKGLL